MASKNDIGKLLTFELPVFLVLAVGLPLTQFAASGVFYLLQSLALTLFFGFLFRKSENSNPIFLLVATFLAAGFHRNLFLNYGLSALNKSLKALAFVLFLLSLWLIIADQPKIRSRKALSISVAVLNTVGILIWPPFFLFYFPIVFLIISFKFSIFTLRTKNKKGFDLAHESVWIFPLTGLLLLVILGFFVGKKPFIFISPRYLRFEEFKQLLVFLIIFLPVFVLIILAWKKLYPLFEKEKQIKKLLYPVWLHPLLVFLSTLFISYPASDSRPFHLTALLFGQICFLTFLGLSGPKNIKDTWNLFASSITSRPLIFLAALIYMMKAWNYFIPY